MRGAPDGRALVSVSWGLLVDRLSGTLILVVTGVGLLVHVYSASYMSHEDDGGYARYFTYLNLFVAAMLVLVLGDSLALTFVGWEGVGLCSYLLIGFWYTDEQKAFCGRKAFVVNRIGDFGFLLGLFAILSVFGTANYGQLEVLARAARVDWVLQSGVFSGWTVKAAITFATLGLFTGAAGKSAQLPKDGIDHQRIVQGKDPARSAEILPWVHRVGKDPARSAEILPWVHRVFGNLKTWLRGTFHGVSRKHLPGYVVEFSYRFDPRWREEELFRFVLRRAAHGAPLPYNRLIAE